MSRTFTIFLLTFALMVPVQAGADLIDRGNGLIYDTDLDITWLQDAGLAARSFGRAVSWYEAQDWVANLEYNGFDDWRLPTTPGTGSGYLNEGEMGHLYYSELGNPAGGPFSNIGPFIDIQLGYYWTGTETSPSSDSAFHFYFYMGGYQYIDNKLNGNNVWPVRDGDVVPKLVGGAVIGLNPETGKVTCRNLTTRKTMKITFPLGVRSWDCKQAGLVVNPGDKIRMMVTVAGPAD